MLSDEEKEALDKLSSKKNETTWNDTIRQIKREEIKDVVVTRQKYITAVLNLIEKQSKEIEELKQNIHLKEVYVLKTNDYIKGTNVEDELCNKKWDDKIKAKIEEWDNKDLTICYSGRSQGRTFQQAVYYEVKKVLQSLLEKE